MSLRTRLSLINALGLFLGFVLFASFAYLLFVQQQNRQLEDLVGLELTRLQSLFKSLEVGPFLQNNENFKQQLVLDSGRVFLPFNDSKTLPLYTSATIDKSYSTEPQLIGSIPWIRASGEQRGSIRVALNIENAIAQRNNLLRSLIISGLGILTLSVLSSLYWTRRAIAPLVRFAKQTQAIDPAKPELANYSGPEDEVADVAKALNTALDGIRHRQFEERAKLAEIAHELAAPLSLVSGHLESLNKQRPDEPQLKAASSAAKELLYTSQDLLTLARGELERPMDWQVFKLSEVVEQVGQEYDGVRLQLHSTGEMVGNPIRMTQVVRNLVRNAVQASPDSAEVLITLEENDDSVLLEVTDKGMGLSKEAQAQIFEQFYSNKTLGTGVGLTVVKEITEQHGGSISIKSELYEGSIFTVEIPNLTFQIE